MIVICKTEFLTCIKEYEKLVFHICFSFTKNYFDAEDLAQETFLAAYSKLDRFDGSNFKAWISAIAANKCKDYLKSASRRSIPTESSDLDLHESQGMGPEEAALWTVGEKEVRAICEQLEEPYRSVAVKYFCEDVPLSELSRDTGQKLKTLQTRLYRAKKMIKEFVRRTADV